MIDAIADLVADEKRRLLARILREKSRAEATARPLSYGERALWFVYQLDRQSSAYNIMYAARVRADLRRDALGRAFQRLVDRHAALRTTYGTQNGVPVAWVHPHRSLSLTTIAASTWDEQSLQRQINAEADRPLDLEQDFMVRVCLFERSGPWHVLLVTAAHIAVDFWSLDLLCDELQRLYREETTGQPAALGPPRAQYTDFVRWQERMLAGPRGEQLWNYWRNELTGPLSPLELPTDRVRSPVQTYRGRLRRFDLPDSLVRRLAALAKAEGATLYMVLLASFQALIHRYTGQPEILVGSPTAGRRAGWEETVGYFLNPIVLRGRLEAAVTFRDFLAQVRQTVVAGLNHQDFPFSLLVERLSPPRDASRSPLFQVAFNWNKPRKGGPEGRRLLPWAFTGDCPDFHGAMDGGHAIDAAAAKMGLSPSSPREECFVQKASGPGPVAVFSDGGGLELDPLAIGHQGAAFDLMLVMFHLGDSLSAGMQYNTDLFDDASIAAMVEHFQTLLESIADSPHRAIGDLALVAGRRRQILLEDWNDTAGDYPRDCCLHEIVAAQAARTPDKTAVECGDRVLTYRELDERSNQLARYLQQCGVGPDRLVGICVERSPEMLVGLLGILKAGGAYVPLAPGTPVGRLAYMLDETRPVAVLCNRHLAAALPGHTGRTVFVDDGWPAIRRESSAPLSRRTGPDNLAYVIFTSGSTGRPKGVQIKHRSVVNVLSLIERRPGISSDDVLLAVTTLTFDISVLELFAPLTVGARVVIVSRETATDGQQLARAIAQSGATIVEATPATWQLLVRAGWTGDRRLKVLCGGDALSRDLADLLLDRGCSLWNMYGPTETTIWSAVDRVLPGTGPVPLGRPIANTQIYLLNGHLQPVPIGATGEIYIGGDGVARGYLNRPELTAERFLDDPFHPGPGRRIYKTGDLARYRRDGTLEFLGRADQQVKIRGFRVEPGEVEAVLTEHPAVREVVVAAYSAPFQTGDKQLVAYLVAAPGVAATTSDLRAFLGKKLPDYMVPATFVTLDALPLNSSGKVDRKALPAPNAARPALDMAYVAPRDDLERALADAWAAVLARDKVGVYDDFFELGGASLQSLEIAARAAEAGVALTPAMLFRYPTIAALAEVLRTQRTTHVTGSAAERSKEDQPPRAFARPTTASRADNQHEPCLAKRNTVVESLGVYLPPNEVTTETVLKGCRHHVEFPLERMTGIHSRRISGEGNYSIDLARKAVEECLAGSKYDAQDIDLLIACNICRMTGPLEYSIEPNTSLQLKRLCGFDNAVAFDVSNACSGMFTAISIVDAFLSIGAIRRGMVVSGEYITAITRTAQLEIAGFLVAGSLDPRIACLTVGDAGAAVLLETAEGCDVGFHELELFTLSRYNRMCIAGPTRELHGGPIMHVPDPILHTAVSTEHSVMHARQVLERSPWPPEAIEHLIIHQTSRRSLRDGMQAMNKAYGKNICHEGNTIDNLAARGNTASTTHFVALWDNIQSGRIKSGDKVVFAVSGSGQTIGTGLYTLDDLPDRLRKHATVHSKQPEVAGTLRVPSAASATTGERHTECDCYLTDGERLRKYEQQGVRPEKAGAAKNMEWSASSPRLSATSRVAVRSIGTCWPADGTKRDTTRLVCAAAEECLKRWDGDRNDIGLLLFAGMTRSGHVYEPAIAAFVAGELKLNDHVQSGRDKKTLAFDVYNAAMGFLNACDVGVRMVQAGKCQRALVVTAEIEAGRDQFLDQPLALREAASAVLIEAVPDTRSGFGPFVFQYATQHQDARTTTGKFVGANPLCDLRIAPEILDHYLEAVPPAVEELLRQEGLGMEQFRVVLPSQFSASFNERLAALLKVPREKVVDLAGEDKDLFTNSLAFSLRHVLDHKLVQPGDIGLVINVASGVQAGCTTYHF